jgi:hypothetical protein
MVFIALSACSKSNFSEEAANFRYEYYPIALGQVRVFQVDSIVFDPLGAGVKVDSTRSYLREVVSDTFRNATGELSYRILRYTRKTLQDPWIFNQTGQEVMGETNLRVQEAGFNLVKLAFPPLQGKAWSSTPYVTPESRVLVAGDPIELFKGWRNARITAFDVQWENYPQSLEVQYGNYENAIELRKGVERYATGIGLVFREFSALNTQCVACRGQSWRQKASTGFIHRLRRI